MSNGRPNQPGSDWQFAGQLHITALDGAFLILTMLKDGRVGGIEFV